MIDTNSLNWANKDFPKETNEIKYLSSVVNDIHNQFNIIKNSVDLENKQQEIFFKGLMTNSKNFMNEISSFNFNQAEQFNLINISMNFGNLFDLISKIYSDENKIFYDKISILFSEFNQHLTQTIKILTEVLNFNFKDFSHLKNKKFQISEKCLKGYKEIELCINNSKTENYSKEKTNEKLIHIFSDFEEKIENFKIIKGDVNHIEDVVEELLRGVYFNVMKISCLYLKFCQSFSQEFIKYRTNFSEKVLNMISLTIESLGVNFSSDGLSDYELKIYKEKFYTNCESINYFFSKNEENIEKINIITSSNPRLNSQRPKIEVKNLCEISENLVNFLNCVPHVTILKKKILAAISKFIQEIFKQIESLVQNFTKAQKNIYILKPNQNVQPNLASTSHSYLLNTSLASIYDFFRNNFEFFLKKNEEIFSQKNNYSIICSSIEAAIKDIANEENNFVHVLLKLNKEYGNYRNTLTKLLIAKEKIISQIANNKETITKLEETSQSLTKIEICLGNLKSEESKINEQINELNNNYKKYLEDFVENFRKNIFDEYKQRDGVRFRELFQDVMLGILSHFERAYHGLYSRLLDEILLKKEKSHENIFLKNDLNALFGQFKNEYLNSKKGCNLHEYLLNIILSPVDAQTPAGILDQACIILSDKDNLEERFCFLSKDDTYAYANVEALNLVKLMKMEEIIALRENNKLLKAKIKANKKSSSTLRTGEFVQLYNLAKVNDELVYKSVYCSYQTGLSLLIPGSLIMTNKRIVFQPFISIKEIIVNKKETISNPNRSVVNCVEFYKDNLISIKEKENFIQYRSLEIKAINGDFTFLFLPIDLPKSLSNSNYILDVINSIKDSLKLNDLNYIPESIKEENRQNELSGVIKPERFSPEFNLEINSNVNFLQPQECDEYYSTLINLNFFNSVNDFNKSQLDFFTENNLIRIKFNETFLKDKPLLINKHDSYIPIHLIYKYIYDDEVQCSHGDYNKAKNFILNLKEIRKDYNISFNKLSHTSEQIPSYYSDPFDYTGQLLSSNSNSEKVLKEFLETMKDSFGVILEYEYKYTHPMKKKFMGPSKLDMNDKYKIIFLSPLCLIVEISSFMSGFMLMDTFYTVAQYKYEAEMYYDNDTKRIAWKTKVTASFAFEFVKDCWFRNKIESNGLVENEDYMRDFVLVHVVKVLEEKSREYYDSVKIRQKMAKDEFIMLNNFTDVNLITEAVACNRDENFVKENKKIEAYKGDQSKLESIDELTSRDNSENCNLDGNSLLVRNNLLLVLLVFSVIVITTVLLSFMFPEFSKSKELILCLIISVNAVLLYKLSEKVSSLQKKINAIESESIQKK